jgi:hypothetical protein
MNRRDRKWHQKQDRQRQENVLHFKREDDFTPPEGFTHAYFSDGYNKLHGSAIYTDINGHTVTVTEVNINGKPLCKRTDLKYIGLVDKKSCSGRTYGECRHF